MRNDSLCMRLSKEIQLWFDRVRRKMFSLRSPGTVPRTVASGMELINPTGTPSGNEPPAMPRSMPAPSSKGTVCKPASSSWTSRRRGSRSAAGEHRLPTMIEAAAKAAWEYRSRAAHRCRGCLRAARGEDYPADQQRHRAHRDCWPSPRAPACGGRSPWKSVGRADGQTRPTAGARRNGEHDAIRLAQGDAGRTKGRPHPRIARPVAPGARHRPAGRDRRASP